MRVLGEKRNKVFVSSVLLALSVALSQSTDARIQHVNGGDWRFSFREPQSQLASTFIELAKTKIDDGDELVNEAQADAKAQNKVNACAKYLVAALDPMEEGNLEAAKPLILHAVDLSKAMPLDSRASLARILAQINDANPSRYQRSDENFQMEEFLLRQSVLVIQGIKGSSPADLADVQVRLGNNYIAQKRYADANTQLTSALTVAGKTGDPNAKWSALISMASLNESRGNLDKAEQNYRELIELDRNAPKQRSSHYVDDISRLIRVLINNHKVDEAAKMVDPLVQESQSGGFWGGANPFGGAARTFEEAGKIDAAEKVLREQLRYTQASMHGMTIGPVEIYQRELCEFLARHGKLDEAISMARQSYEAGKTARFPSSNAQLYESLLRKAGRTGDIEKLNRETEQFRQDQRKASGAQADEKLAKLRSSGGGDNTELMQVLSQRSSLYLQDKQYDKAKPLLDEILSRLDKAALLDSSISNSIESLAHGCTSCGHVEEAQAIQKALFAKIVSTAGKSDSSRQSDYLLDRICNEFQRDNLQKTLEPMLKDGLKKLQSAGDSTIETQIKMLTNLKRLYESEHNFEDEEKTAVQMIAVISKKSDPAEEVAWNRLSLANSYLKHGKQTEADSQAKQALAALPSGGTVGAYFDRTLNELWALSGEYRKMGNRDQADVLLEEAVLLPLSRKPTDSRSQRSVLARYGRHRMNPLDSAIDDYHDSGEDARAEAILNELLQKTRQLAPDSNQVQGFELKLSDIYLKQGNLDKSQTLFNQALKEYEKREGASGASIQFALQRRSILLRQNFHSKEADQIDQRLKTIKHG